MHSRFLMPAVAVTVALCIAAFAVGIQRIRSDLGRRNVESENVTWQVTRLQTDYLLLERDLLVVSAGEQLNDPRMILFEDPERGLLGLRITNVRSRMRVLAEGAAYQALATLPKFNATLEALSDALDLAERRLLRAPDGEQIETTAAAMRAILAKAGDLAGRVNTLAIESTTFYAAHRDVRWHAALSQALRVVLITFAALLLSMTAGLILFARHLRNRKIMQAQRDAHSARLEADAERARTQEILDELPVGVQLLDRGHAVLYGNRALMKFGGSLELSTAAVAPPLDDCGELKGGGPARGTELSTFEPPRTARQLDGRAGIRRVQNADAGTTCDEIVTRLSDGTSVRVLYDVSDLVAAEEQAQKARQEAEDASRAKAAFLANMSHEIRTPMNGVVGMVELLERSALDAEQQDTLRTVKECAFTLLRIIDDILDFSKIEAGELTMERVPVPLRDFAEGALATIAPMALEKSLDLALFIDPELPAAVVSDPTRLRQIVLNLLGNAVKFTSSGWITLTLEVGDPVEDNQRLRVSVTDTGIGIASDKVADLFQPFRQAEISTTRRFGGTGLGLSISERLVTNMGGEIGVTSSPNEGSRFWFTIPAEPAVLESEEAFDTTDLAGLRVLVASDVDVVAKMIGELLSEAGASTGYATSATGVDAAFSSSTRPDVFLVDSRMTVALADWATDLMPGGLDSEAPGMWVLRSAEADDRREFVGFPVRRRSLLASVGAVLEDKVRGSVAATGDRDPASMAGGTPAVRPPRSGQRILVAEDTHTNRILICRQLELLGYSFEVTTNGEEALEAYRRGRFDLVLTDCLMPELDGFGLTAAIRALDAAHGRHTPIVALTANALVGEAERCRQAGMDDYLAKPVYIEALGAMLERWCGQPDAGCQTSETGQTTDISPSASLC